MDRLGAISRPSTKDGAMPDSATRSEKQITITRTGGEFPVCQEVLEVAAPELLALCHEPMPDHGMLKEIVTRIEFHEHEGSTRVEVTGGPYPAEMGASAEQGWGQQFDKLARLLSA